MIDALDGQVYTAYDIAMMIERGQDVEFICNEMLYNNASIRHAELTTEVYISYKKGNVRNGDYIAPNAIVTIVKVNSKATTDDTRWKEIYDG